MTKIERPELSGPDFSLEAQAYEAGLGPVAGIDEVGRGPLAGPVCVAAVVLDPASIPQGLDDSKRLSAKRRQILYAEILRDAVAVAVALSPAEEIDRLNIRGATLMSMARAARRLAVAPGFALIDGRDIPKNLPCPAQAVIGGDGKSLSIAAASIVAKVFRDSLMARLDARAPGYGFAVHAGYPTAAHRNALERLGPSPFHRRSFGPVARFFAGK